MTDVDSDRQPMTTSRRTLSEASKKPKVLVIRMRRRDGTVVLFSDVQSQPLIALERASLLLEIGAGNLFENIDEALAAAETRVG